MTMYCMIYVGYFSKIGFVLLDKIIYKKSYIENPFFYFIDYINTL